MTLLSLHFSLPLGWEGRGSWEGEGARDPVLTHQQPLILCLPTIHSRAPLDPHGQHMVVEALSLQAPHLLVELNLLPLETLQSIQENGGL